MSGRAAQPVGGASRLWAAASPLALLVGVPFTVGLAALVVPLVVWLVRKDVDPFASAHGREGLNFALSLLLYAFAFGVLAIVTIGFGLLVAIPGWIGIALVWLYGSIAGTVKALNDQPYRYPLTIRFFTT